MNLCIDQGNSSTKIGVFEGDEPVYFEKIQQPDYERIIAIFKQYKIKHSILSSVIQHADKLNDFLKSESKRHVLLSHHTHLPIINNYSTPETLGKDRLAAVTGAVSLLPETDLLVIDAGTAITYDFVDASGIYHGGNIAPGLNLRAKSLHEFTQNLPLVELKAEVDFLGNDTHSAIQAGVLYGIVLEIDGYIERLMLKYPKLSVFLTGGSRIFFENKLKNRIFANENLVLIGLNRILQYNV
jgi:type III pantothenate kinase